jgi:uncharacterized protein YecE (DUF72 family)
VLAGRRYYLPALSAVHPISGPGHGRSVFPFVGRSPRATGIRQHSGRRRRKYGRSLEFHRERCGTVYHGFESGNPAVHAMVEPSLPAAVPGRIRVGIGGWDYEPWRGTFYPRGTHRSRELEYASRRLSSIEVNGTFYRLQRPAVYREWHDSTPDDFQFSIKAPRFIVARKDLSSAGAAVARFVSSGIAELRSKLGPILWQLAPAKHFDAGELAAFLRLLPRSVGELPLRHALEVRHPSFMNADFLGIVRAHEVAVVVEDDDTHPCCADVTSDFVYARLRRSIASIETGYAADALELWAQRAQSWSTGAEPADLPKIAPQSGAVAAARDVFVYFINGAKERAPAAAEKLLSLLG